jgi:hypothetical protein
MTFRLATYDGSVFNPYIAVVKAFSLGNPGVHTEIWIDDHRVSTFQIDRCVCMVPMDGSMDTAGWHTVNIPITNHKEAMRFIEEAMHTPAQYSISLAEVAMSKRILDYLDHDMDCCHPELWGKLFCSQLALLFLRRCAVAGILDIPKDKQKLLWSVNSKGCLPGRLQLIADQIFH